MTKFDVLTIGNAIVDIIARCDDQFLIDNAITKAAMNLIDAERAELLYSRMGPAIEASGGSAGNTAAGIANFGGKLLKLAHQVNIHQNGSSSSCQVLIHYPFSPKQPQPR